MVRLIIKKATHPRNPAVQICAIRDTKGKRDVLNYIQNNAAYRYDIDY